MVLKPYDVLGAVRMFAPNAVLSEESDGNVVIILNLMLNDDGELVRFDDDVYFEED